VNFSAYHIKNALGNSKIQVVPLVPLVPRDILVAPKISDRSGTTP